MNRLTFALLAISLLSLSRSFAQTNDEMKAMAAYATPGDIHKMMARSAGNWTSTITMWAQPGAKPDTSTAEVKNEMILGGRYLQGTNTGNYMGMPFTGISTTGYDNAKKSFFNTWIDNMGTGIMVLTGNWDASSNSILFTGSMVDPSSGKDIPIREVLKFIDDDHQVMQMYVTAGGKDFEMMEIKTARK